MIGRLYTIPACNWSNCFGCFRQYKNPGQDMSHVNGTYGHHTYLGTSKFKCTSIITDRCVVLGADAQQSGVSARGVCRCGKCSRGKLRKDRLHARHRIRPQRIRVWSSVTRGAQKKVKTHDHSHFVALRSKQGLHCHLKWFLSYLDKEKKCQIFSNYIIHYVIWY